MFYQSRRIKVSLLLIINRKSKIIPPYSILELLWWFLTHLNTALAFSQPSRVFTHLCNVTWIHSFRVLCVEFWLTLRQSFQFNNWDLWKCEKWIISPKLSWHCVLLKPCIVKETLTHPWTNEEKWPLYMGGIGAADIFPCQANMSVSLAHTAIRISHLFPSRPITALNTGRVSLTNTGLSVLLLSQ